MPKVANGVLFLMGVLAVNIPAVMLVGWTQSSAEQLVVSILAVALTSIWLFYVVEREVAAQIDERLGDGEATEEHDSIYPPLDQ